MRRSIFVLVKFLSRLFTALNLLPSIATVASVNHHRDKIERPKGNPQKCRARFRQMNGVARH
jgi:hypothetical protein